MTKRGDPFQDGKGHARGEVDRHGQHRQMNQEAEAHQTGNGDFPRRGLSPVEK